MNKEAQEPQGVDNFEFQLVGPVDALPFLGYASSPDKTSISPQLMIKGSKNIYKKLSGTLAARTGLKLRGAVDSTLAKVDSSFEWTTWDGRTLPLRVSNGKLQVESDILVSGTPIWYTLLSSLTKTRWVFDAWWDNTNKKDVLLMVDGTSNLRNWSGAMALLSSSNTSNASGTVATMALQSPGTGYAVNDVVTISGGGGTGATATVNSVSGTGAILTYTLTTRGSGYSNTAAATTTNSGAGINATITITVATGNIGLDRAAVTAGFSATGGSVVINGNTYTYASASASSLLGISPDPTGEANNSIVMDAVNSNSNQPSSTFLNDFLRVINNQVYVGSYTSRLIYVSKTTSYIDYTQSTPRIPGDGDLITLDSNGKGIGIRQGNPWISAGTDEWYEVSFSQITVGSTLSEQTKVDKKPVSTLSAALGHEFIDMIGDTLVVLCQDQQVRQIGLFTDQFETKFPSLSLALQDELKDEVFTTGHLRAIGNIIYVTAPNNGRDYMLERREAVNALGQITTNWFWHPPQIRNVSRFAVISGVVFGHSNSFPQLYQIWDTGQWHDDSPLSTTMGVPYECYMRLAYQQSGRRQGKTTFDKIYAEGYITQGTKLYGNVFFDYKGASGTSNLDLNGTGTIPLFTGAGAPSLGDSSLGDNPLGDGLVIDSSDQESLPKFRIIKGVPLTDCYEYAIELYTQDLDSRWEVLAIGANATESESDGIEIMR